MTAALLHVAVLLGFPPLLLGVIGRTKAWFAGRRGPPLVQPYFDLVKLLRKGAVYSRTSTWVFRAGPLVSLAALVTAGLLVPLGAGPPPLAFEGDVLAFAYLLGLSRFATMAAALDTGSSFEGMGASREAALSALAEPAFLLALAIVCVPAASLSFAGVLSAPPGADWGAAHPEILIAAAAIFCVLLAECSRVPFDDPATHLELTMIHEVMVLDHGGVDLALILHGAAVKLFLLSALLARLLLPVPDATPWGLPLVCASTAAIAVAVGVVESAVARLRLVRVPQLLVGAAAVAAVGLIAVFFRSGS